MAITSTENLPIYLYRSTNHRFQKAEQSLSDSSFPLIITKLTIKAFVGKSKITLLTIIDKYDVPISQWTWLHQTLLKVPMNMIALSINVGEDYWTAERATMLHAVSIEPGISCDPLWCLPTSSWANLANINGGIFNLTFVGAPKFNFWTLMI